MYVFKQLTRHHKEAQSYEQLLLFGKKLLISFHLIMKTDLFKNMPRQKLYNRMRYVDKIDFVKNLK